MEKTKGNQLISERMRDIGISSNQLSLLSGVSNAHLRQILEGLTRDPSPFCGASSPEEIIPATPTAMITPIII